MLMEAVCNLCAANGTRAVRAAGRNCAQAGTTNVLVWCFVPWQLAAPPLSLSFISLLRFDCTNFVPLPRGPLFSRPPPEASRPMRVIARLESKGVVVEATVETEHDAQVHNTEG